MVRAEADEDKAVVEEQEGTVKEEPNPEKDEKEVPEMKREGKGIKREVEKVPHKTGRRKALKPEEIVQMLENEEEEVEASNVEEARRDAAEAANTTPNKFF